MSRFLWTLSLLTEQRANRTNWKYWDGSQSENASRLWHFIPDCWKARASGAPGLGQGIAIFPPMRWRFDGRAGSVLGPATINSAIFTKFKNQLRGALYSSLTRVTPELTQVVGERDNRRASDAVTGPQSKR